MSDLLQRMHILEAENAGLSEQLRQAQAELRALGQLIAAAQQAGFVWSNEGCEHNPALAAEIQTINQGDRIAECTKPCADPSAPIVPCARCGKPVYTCERTEAEDGDYRCPAHPDGVQFGDGKWVCSAECYDALHPDPTELYAPENGGSE